MRLRHLHYSWVMLLISFSLLATQPVVFYTFGVFLKPLTIGFHWDRGELSGAFSLCMLLAGVFAIITGRLSDKYGPRLLVTGSGLLIGVGFLLMSQVNSLWQLYLIWGLFMGIGASLCYLPVVSTVPRWFAKKTGLAIGITFAGFGLGAVVVPPLTQWLISTYDWRLASTILGIIVFLTVIPLAQLMRHSPQRVGLKAYGEVEVHMEEQALASATEAFSFSRIVKTGQFWGFALVHFCYLVCEQIIIIHLVPHIVDNGIKPLVAASMLSIMAGVSIIGRLSMGFISDRVGGRLALSTYLTVFTLAILWLIFSRELWMFYTFAVVFGLAYGGTYALLTFVSVKVFGLSSLGIILGSFLLCGTVGGALGPFVAGSIFDITGSYNLAFLICVILGTLAIILSLILLRYKAKKGALVSN